MSLPEYEFRGLMAQSWDLLRGDTSNWDDRFFYLDAIRRYGEPVLDVGCGTGRILLDYLQQGIDIDGVDNSPEMLALCREKARRLGLSPVLFEQYMEELALPRRYRTILVPSSSLGLVIDPPMVDRAIQRFLDHMEPGAALISPLTQLWKEGDPLESEWTSSAERPEDHATIRRVERSRYDPATELEHAEATYQVIMDGKVVAEETHRRSPAVRSYTQAQTRALYERNGLEDVTLYHEFTFEPARPEDRLFTAIGRKPR
jgi:ubiquinone/menaquinone biosynthesis C-methylase UbiE